MLDGMLWYIAGEPGSKMNRKAVLAQKVNAGADRNGNPRRGWLIYTRDGGFLGFHDEGYAGWRGVTLEFPHAIELAVVLGIELAAYKTLVSKHSL